MRRTLSTFAFALVASAAPSHALLAQTIDDAEARVSGALHVTPAAVPTEVNLAPQRRLLGALEAEVQSSEAIEAWLSRPTILGKRAERDVTPLPRDGFSEEHPALFLLSLAAFVYLILKYVD